PFIITGLCDRAVCPLTLRFNGSDIEQLPAALQADSAVTHYPSNMDPKSRIKPTRSDWPTALQSSMDSPLPQIVQWSSPSLSGWRALLDGMPPISPPLVHSDAWLSLLGDKLATEFVSR